jgi:hypothetical protein
LKLSAAETEIAANRERNKSAEQRTVEVDELRAALAAQRNEHEMRAAPLGAKVAATDEGEVEKLHAALQAQREQAASHVASLSEKVTVTETASEELRAQLEAQRKEHAAKILAAETEARELRAALATQQDEDTVGRTKSANDEELLGAKAEADQLGAALDATQREHALHITASNAKIDAAEAQVFELRAELQALQKHVASAAGGGTASPRAARETQRGEHPIELTLTFDKLSVEQFDAQMQSDFLSELASGLGLVDSNDPAGPHIKLRKCAAGSLVVHCTVHGLPSSAAAAKVREIAARGQLLDASHWGSYRCVVAEGSDDRALIAAAPFIRTRMTDAPVRVAVPTATPRANSRIVSPRASTENWDRVRHDEATVAPTSRVRSAQRMRIDDSAKWAMPRQEQVRSSKSARHIETTLASVALNSVPQCDDNSAQSSSIECARINQTAKRIEALLARKGSDVENMAPEKAPEKRQVVDDEQLQRKKLSAHIWTKLAEVEPNHDDAGNNAHSASNILVERSQGAGHIEIQARVDLLARHIEEKMNSSGVAAERAEQRVGSASFWAPKLKKDTSRAALVIETRLASEGGETCDDASEARVPNLSLTHTRVEAAAQSIEEKLSANTVHGALPTPTRNDSPLSTIAAKLGDADIANPQQTKPKRSTDGTLSDVRARSVTQRLDEKLGPDRSSKSLASAVPFEGAGKATDRVRHSARRLSDVLGPEIDVEIEEPEPPPISPTRYRSVRSASLRHPEEAANTAPIRAELDARVRTAKALALGGRLGVASQPSAPPPHDHEQTRHEQIMRRVQQQGPRRPSVESNTPQTSASAGALIAAQRAPSNARGETPFPKRRLHFSSTKTAGS